MKKAQPCLGSETRLSDCQTDGLTNFQTLGLPNWLAGWLAIFELIVYRLVFGEPQHMFLVFSISNKTTMIIQIVLLYTFGVFNKTQ